MFKKLKGRFTKKLVLATLNLNKKMKVKVDILDYTIGEVLFMEYEDER